MNIENRTKDNDEEQPLDEASEKVRQKLVKMLGVSIGTLIVGIAAVLFAIIYKVNSSDESKTAQAPAATQLQVPAGIVYEGVVDLPDGASVISSSLDGGNILMTVRLGDGSTQIWLYDLNEARVFGRIDVK